MNITTLIRYSFLLLSLLIISSCSSKQNKTDLIIFHAGSLSIPFKQLKTEFEKIHPNVNVVLEAAGSVTCARKITDLKRECDIIASADVKIIDEFLVPDYVNESIPFATNSMVIAYTSKSKYFDDINETNWIDILLRKDVRFGRSDPNSDPCGYRSLLTIKLAEKSFKKDSLFERFIEKDKEFIRPKASDLIALLQTNNLDYIFTYTSVVHQFDLSMLILSDSLNLSNPKLANHYKKVSVYINGKKPGESIELFGEPMIYGIAQLNNSKHPAIANKFIKFLKSKKGIQILNDNGH